MLMLGCALDPGLHMLGRALHSGLHNKVACVLVQHGVVCCFSTLFWCLQVAIVNFSEMSQNIFEIGLQKYLE